MGKRKKLGMKKDTLLSVIELDNRKQNYFVRQGKWTQNGFISFFQVCFSFFVFTPLSFLLYSPNEEPVFFGLDEMKKMNKKMIGK